MARPAAGDIAIRVAGLQFAVAERMLIDIPLLEIPRAGVTIVLGPNGAGKSMLLRLLHNVLVPMAGEITFPGFAGQPRQAMVFQKPVLLRRSAAANIAFAARAAGLGRIDPAPFLERAGLAGRARQPARTLSGGEQQKLAMARALAVWPDLLFLDEPAANLDPNATAAIEELVRASAASGVKVVMVTHDIAQARRLADDVVFCHRGSIREHRPAEGFFEAAQSAEAQTYLSGHLLGDS